WFLMFFFYKFFPLVTVKRISNDKLTSLVLNVIISIFFLTVIYISWRYTGFRVTFNLFNVYDLRSEALAFQLPAVIDYIYSASRAINPVLLIYFLVMKKYHSAAFVFVIQIFSFSINGSKTVMFTTIIAILIYIFYKSKYKKAFVWFLAILCSISILENVVYKGIFILAFLIRRVLFLPNLLNSYYFDFFEANPPDYLSQSFLRHFGLESNYISIDNMIGMIYFNQPDMGANNGLISDAMANFGELGVLLYPLLIVITLRFMDLSTKGLDQRVFVISAVTISFIFISSFYFTILFTHGLFALVIVLFLLPRKQKVSKNGGE
ncbi:hypothetical protein V7195_24820, partial [Priestia megaterium]|uniref:hypothetical protein n=1 Tax=Priestia megaterium TaxID=1404 RepID=UPI00300BC785